ncbi:hypothetical protein NQ317_011503 [Molorchus minor]|uniref:60S ribosomal protein L34 n=1 Tax=Molorchus minor TaxID=1323400 RepID=A0ABQ9J1V0_9CUCU|nr:hypothetical protein NQ317_011503 [Molorchus minor]
MNNETADPNPTGKMVQRLVFRRRLSYNTKSNRRHIVRTPGGRLVYQYLKKPKKIPRCGQCNDKLRGILPARPPGTFSSVQAQEDSETSIRWCSLSQMR